ncbi:hypothetical protein Pan216_47220 [Planctomycetes bacterium Pan216]|uniref:Putative nickel insertion protein n=1 Tax=Kolteria novifilia TaxID=2527975 RepID=A0A518BA37_9BACT|nr:hypothetical protein Pan216_47220 [Planctomycetes bacterium Pan216]
MTRVLHLDCFSGVSGDMMLGALIDLGVPEGELSKELSTLGLDGTLHVSRIRKSGFAAVSVEVISPPEQPHRHLSTIERMITASTIAEPAKERALRIFRKLGEAEAASHGIAIEKVHFHEVGAVDSIFDIVGTAIGMNWLGVDRVTCTPIPTGRGTVRCAHGVLPVPAPATARLLVGVPLADVAIESELTTPTGAAIVAATVDEFVNTPPMTIERVGMGAGSRDLEEQPNLLRLFLGEIASHLQEFPSGRVWQVETNLDDVTPEVVAYAKRCLLDLGALDVWTAPIQMKKDRPAVMLGLLCHEGDRDRLEASLFRETKTFGMRRWPVERTVLDRVSHSVTTRWGVVRGKIGTRGDIESLSVEYDDCARLAREHGVSLGDVQSEALERLRDVVASAGKTRTT